MVSVILLNIASLYEAFSAEEAHSLARRLELYFTPRNGSWLNITEIELSVLHQQCLKRRIGDAQTLERELDAWQQQRNQEAFKIHWRFTTQDDSRCSNQTSSSLS